ncbi:hypothetical protein RvY_08454 [Ramazzottius varieornatus]|uniref:Chromo domain-containing protein n=1 Tax=Ramazzottius varieornatus TaxID=947166 RepID=A0A1D1V5X2_RAMVA|nr:hypothetical protein RvY_08454 [Ramazzottius varieornatus]
MEGKRVQGFFLQSSLELAPFCVNVLYVVEKILGRKYYKDNPNTGVPNQYLVKWKDWPDTTNSWVYYEDMQCTDLIQEYLVEKDLSISRKEKEKRLKEAKSSGTAENAGLKTAETSGGYHVEAVLKHRGSLHPKTNLPMEFLLKWEGYSEKQNLLDESSEDESGSSRTFVSSSPQTSSQRSLNQVSSSSRNVSLKRLRTESSQRREKYARSSAVATPDGDFRKTGAGQSPASESGVPRCPIPSETSIQSTLDTLGGNVDRYKRVEEVSSLMDVERERESILLTSDEEWD